MKFKKPSPFEQMQRVDCEILVGKEWVPAHLSQVREKDFFRLLDSHDVHLALGDAEYFEYEDEPDREGEWKISAKWYKTEKGKLEGKEKKH